VVVHAGHPDVAGLVSHCREPAAYGRVWRQVDPSIRREREIRVDGKVGDARAVADQPVVRGEMGFQDGEQPGGTRLRAG
jgi:hypothetical protein